jgi:DNA polymerase-3 subunit beta
VLANVLLEADEQTGKVGLTAFDLSLGIQTKFDAQVEESGDMTLPAKLLNDIVSRLANGEITLDDDAGEAIATLTSTSGKYKVRGMGTEEFPELPVVEDGDVTHIPAAALLEGLRGSLFAASTDETKQVLMGVHLIVKKDTLEFAATDGHRLAVVETTQQDADSVEVPETQSDIAPLEVTIPARALRELERMIGMRHAGEEVALHISQGQIVFVLASQRLTSRTLEGQYPDYRQLIPQEFSRQVTLDRRQVISALERIAVLTDQKNSLVKFTIDSLNQEVSLSVDSKDVGSGRESMPAEISGEDIDVGFNVKYFLEGLKAIPSTHIQIQLNEATNPVILTPVSGLKMTYLIMPLQIR